MGRIAGALLGAVVGVADLAAGTLPTTGRAIPLLAAGVAIGVALLLRVGRSRLDDHDDD